MTFMTVGWSRYTQLASEASVVNGRLEVTGDILIDCSHQFRLYQLDESLVSSSFSQNISHISVKF